MPDSSNLTLDGLRKTYGAVTAVSDVNLAMPHGKLVCLLGPSGCGKTTLLRLIAGLESASAGVIRLNGNDLTDVPAHRRGFGMVFQSLALFPHLNVADNIGYPLRIRGVDRPARRQRAAELLDLVRLDGVADRQITQLSGGQRQRVAIARALALDPKLFLLDEPLSALDAKLREAMQVELRQLQRRLGITTVVVTHDQREAMTMADVVVVMNQGQVQQVGNPLDIYRRPANTFVADFIGTSNLLSGIVTGPGEVKVADVPISVPAFAENLPSGSKVTVSIRPEEIHLVPGGVPAPNTIPGTVSFIRDVGASVEITVACGPLDVLAIATPKERPAVGVDGRVAVEFPVEACVVLPA